MTTVAQLDILSAQKGHDEKTITITDTPDERAKLAKHVKRLVKDGFMVFLADGRRVVGYDEVSNEWILKDKQQRASALEEKATAVAPIAGG